MRLHEAIYEQAVKRFESNSASPLDLVVFSSTLAKLTILFVRMKATLRKILKSGHLLKAPRLLPSIPTLPSSDRLQLYKNGVMNVYKSTRRSHHTALSTFGGESFNPSRPETLSVTELLLLFIRSVPSQSSLV